MTDDLTEAPAASPGTGAVPPALASLFTSERLIALGIPALLFLVTFLTFWFYGPQDSPYVQHVNQSNAFLHGRTDLAPEYSKNLNVLERVLDSDVLKEVDKGIVPPPCGEVTCYLSHQPMPAILMLPFVAIFGLSFNQTLFSVFFGALTASLVFLVARALTKRLSTQIWLTVLFVFGTIFWFTAANGGVWFVSHTVTVFFLFLAIYATLVPRNPLLAGFCLGAAYLTRQTAAMSLPFFLIMFSDQWLIGNEGEPLWKRVNLKPLVQFAAAAAPFVIFSFTFNYLRFGNPLDGGYYHLEEMHTPGEVARVYQHGPFHYTYVSRHFGPFLEALPILQTSAPYVLPSWSGQAFWATTPALFYAFFAGMRNRWLVLAGIAAVVVTTGIIISQWISGLWESGWQTYGFPNYSNLYPLLALIGVAIWVSRRNRLAVACWAAITPTALTISAFAATGWAQFGYRQALDFYPFLFLLTAIAIGDRIRWHHMALIAAGVVINLWAVTWIYQFQPHQYLGLDWVRF